MLTIYVLGRAQPAKCQPKKKKLNSEKVLLWIPKYARISKRIHFMSIYGYMFIF